MSNMKQRLEDGSTYVGPIESAIELYKQQQEHKNKQDALLPLIGKLENNAAKNDLEKPDLSHVPVEFLNAVAQAFMVGEKKYGRYNYYKGHKASQLIAAAMRHLTAWMNGEENDPVDGQPHLGSVGACVAMLLKQQKLGTLIDNRYKEEKK